MQDVDVGVEGTRAKGLAVGRGVDVFGPRIVPHLRDGVVGRDGPALSDSVAEANVFDAVEKIWEVGLDVTNGVKRRSPGKGVASVGVEGTIAGGGVYEIRDALRAIHVQNLGIAMSTEAAGEEAHVAVDGPGGVFVRSPGHPEARREVDNAPWAYSGCNNGDFGRNGGAGSIFQSSWRKRASRYWTKLRVGLPVPLGIGWERLRPNR